MSKRKHHFVPKAHLVNFTVNGKLDGKLHIFDFKTGNQFSSTPEGIAHKRDLYAVETIDDNPDLLEDAFAELESEAIPIVKEIISNMSIPTGRKYETLITYIALLSERTPSRIKHMASNFEAIGKLMLRTDVEAPNSLERYKDYTNRSDGAGFDSFKQFVSNEDNYSIDFGNNMLLEHLLYAVDAIIPTMMARNWGLIYSPHEVGDFVCSDCPVSLHWLVEKERGIYSSPGHGLIETEISVPLSSRVLLIGRFQEINQSVYEANTNIHAAVYNSYTSMNAERHVYSRLPNFYWCSKNNTIADTDDFIEMIKGSRL